jgi:3-phytase
MMKKYIAFFIFPALTLLSCNYLPERTEKNKQGRNPPTRSFEVQASVQTEPVPDPGDAADDPAIWVNYDNPSQSLIVGTNKQRGLVVYNLAGEQVFSYDCGRVNNVDIRQGFPLGDEKIDIAGASNRSGNIITLVRIMPSGELIDISARVIRSELNEVYGFCLYHEKETDTFYAFVNGKNGGVEQWHLFDDGKGKIDAAMVRGFKLDSQPEGCVADDELGYFYIGEENKAIWKFDASADGSDDRKKVDSVKSPYIKADIEGLTLYFAPGGKGYLIASSQGNNSFAVYEREGNNKYLGSFRITDGTIDGVQETDGIDISSANLGKLFPHGVFVAQDGYNKEGGNNLRQNFKLVRWEVIAGSFDPDLYYAGDHESVDYP